MSIVVKPQVLVKGVPVEVSLSKADLLAIPAVSSHETFGDISNWSTVTITMRGQKRQKKNLIFDATLEVPKYTLDFSRRTLDDYRIDSIIIQDFDHGVITLGVSDIPTAIKNEFEVTVATPYITEDDELLITESGEEIIL